MHINLKAEGTTQPVCSLGNGSGWGAARGLAGSFPVLLSTGRPCGEEQNT